MTEHRIAVNGTELFYTKDGIGAPLLLIHGNGEDHTVFGDLSGLLKDHFTVYGIDSRGHGKSGKSDTADYEIMAADMAEFICRLELPPVMICGFSDGAIISVLLSYKYPDLVKKQVAAGINVQPSGLKLQWRIQMKIGYLFTRDPNLKLMLTQPDITPAMLHKIATPTLLLAGSRDMIYQSHFKEVESHMPNARLEILPGETHDSYIKDAWKLKRVMESFLME